MADMLKFKKGLHAALPETKSAGTIYVTTDERAMYVDVDNSTRIRLGDIVQFDRYDDFKKAAPPFSQEAFYYLIEENLLFKYRGLDEQGQHKWQQINSVSDVQASVRDLEEALDSVKGEVTGLQTAVTDITKTDGAIDVAKQAAIDAAAGDATTKANAAEAAAKADTKEKVDALTLVVNGKADSTALEGAVSALEGKITKAQTDAATDATNKANAAQAAAEETAANALSAAKTELEGKINNKVDQSAFDTTIATLETKADASAKLTEAKGYTDTEIGKLDVKIGANTTAITNEASRADQAEKALGLRIDGVNTQITGINTTLEGLATKTELANQKADLEGQIATAKSGAVSDAKTYTDGQIDLVEAEVAKKAVKADVDAAIESITKADTGLIAVAKKEAIDAAALDATSKAGTAESNAKGYTDTKIGEVNAEIAKKAVKADVDAAIENITKAETGLIAVAQKAAEGYADTVAGTAESNAKAFASTEIEKAQKALQANIDLKANQSALEQAITDLQQYADDAETAAKTYTDGKVAQALAEADAMTFRGTVSLSKALPTTGVQCGDVYKVAEKATYAGIECYVGDLLIAAADQGEEATYAGGWEHVSSGYEDDYDPALSVEGNKVFLRNTVGIERGSVTFVAKDESVNVSVAGEADPATGIANTTVTIGIEWGTF